MEMADESESFELVEVAGQQGLFTNARIKCSEVPSGMFKYDIRHGELGEFCTLEKSVAVNHGGTILTDKPIELGSNGYLPLTGDDRINFLGEEMTVGEFADREQYCSQSLDFMM